MKPQKRKVYKSALAAILVGLIICNPSTSLGWGAGGHMMVAQIAFKRLNPRARAKANELLAIPIKATKVARQRVAWGGYRLAALLNDIWP